ncbi:hypothetical protein [Noviluteimonas gilva]|uniref:Uncharacterized protein n=1 Tax=Noviluteimonas gilva TaxID=2682097 RepID=A0A7C9HLC6_9GAMM|nr:hypothetical protein [Lysobacter gilvus]MUV13590.1 hypothetical protein [Lysobacter gilvus]
MNQIEVSVSKNGGHTFSDPRLVAAGETGEFVKRLILRRWGIGHHIVFKIRVTGDFRANLMAAYMQTEPAGQ